MEILRYLVAPIVLCCLVEACYGVKFSSLPRTLLVNACVPPGKVLKAGEDTITISWSFDKTLPPCIDSTDKTIKVKLCYAPISQKHRDWRETKDNLKHDKTCQFDIVAKPYCPSNNFFTWKINNEIPTATYFVRAYAFNSDGVQVAYGQSTDDCKRSNLFEIQGITGLNRSIYIATACFSAFPLVILFVFAYIERRNWKRRNERAIHVVQ